MKENLIDVNMNKVLLLKKKHFEKQEETLNLFCEEKGNIQFQHVAIVILHD